MDFNYTPEQEKYRMEVRAWLEANQPPPLTEEEKQNSDDEFLWKRVKAWHSKLYKAGWAGLTWPKEYGGRGATSSSKSSISRSWGGSASRRAPTSWASS